MSTHADELTTADLEMPEGLFMDLWQAFPVMADDDEPSPYPDADETERGAQDDLDELGAGGAVRTGKEAVLLGREWIMAAVFLGVGYCLKTIRSLFGVQALWPDAETAYENAEHKHPFHGDLETFLARVPWAVPIWWVNDRYGHVALYIGKGWCITTDYKEPGKLCIARVSALASWCRGTLAGWTEDINGERVWSPKAEPAPKPKPWGSPADRLTLVENRLKAVKANKAKAKTVATRQRLARKVKGLTVWRDQLRERVAKLKENDR